MTKPINDMDRENPELEQTVKDIEQYHKDHKPCEKCGGRS